MYSALINAVLRSSPDYDLLFESLCWPEDSLPQTELVESLTALIEALAPSLTIPDLAQVTLTDAKRRCIHDKIESIIWSKCLPFLRKISTESGGEDRCRQGTAAVCRLLAVSVSVCDQKTWTKVVSSTLPSLQWSPEEELSGALSVNVAAEVLAALMPLPTADEEFTLSILNCALSSIPSLPDNLVSKVTVRVILTLLNCFSDVRSSCFATRIMDAVCSWHSSERSAAVTQRALLCFTVLLDHLLKSHTVTSDTRFWTLVQDGLTHGDSVSRKRALYLLKRCVAPTVKEALFNWAPDKSGLLREFWEDYTLVMETLEENQVHVVRPVLNRIDTLIQATANDSLFHPSWLLCVYQRMFHSENKSLMREGVCHLLELQVLRQSAFAAAFSQSVGDCPELAGKLQVFLVNFFTSLPSEDRGCVLLQLIQQLGSKHWCAVPLLFICQALSKLPQSPLLRSSGLSALREVLRSTMITHQVLLRGAAQCFLLKSTLSLIDSEVTRDDVFSFLMHFRADESLCRGTTLWNELARAILLCVDMERRELKKDARETLRSLLSPLLDTLSRVYTNIYLPVHKSDKSLQLMLRLLQLSTRPQDDLMLAIEQAVVEVVDPVQNFILRRLCGELQEKITIALSYFNVNNNLIGKSSYLPTKIFPFFFNSDLVTQGLLQQDWGRIAASFLRDQWVCLNFLIRSVGIPKVSETLRAALSCSVEALALLPSDLVLPVLNFMNMLVDDEEDLCVQAVNLSWELVQGLSNNAHDFWPALQGFISIAFQHELLKLNHQQLDKITSSSVVELSQSKSGVLGVLVQHCTQTWLPGEGGSSELADGIFSSVFNHLDIVTEACLYGPVFRRDQRLIQDVQIFVEQLGENCAANVAVASDNRDDQLPRTCVLTFLSRLDPCNQQHQRLIEELVVELLRKDSLISKAKVRYYSNSLQHRIKNRAWQTLLLLLPKLTEVSRKDVFEAGFCSNQPSVKYLIEWMMILILVKYPHHLDRFWTCFSFDHEKTKTSICTFLSVLVHISVIIPHVEDKVDQLRKALDIILQSCFNHNFSVRLYALVALKRVWSLAESVTEGDAFRGLSSVVTACLNQAEAMQNSGNANKNWLRIQGHFFFSAFHPIRDYSLE
uniref:Probable methyltransferase TARBP1 n=1 Tax=Cyprinodon variegatus TaxID=28743 RepID=A0A3Q2DPR5_CYPVA